MHRWKLFENLKENKIQKCDEFDSRKNWYKYRDYDLALLPYGKSTDHYFTQSKCGWLLPKSLYHLGHHNKNDIGGHLFLKTMLVLIRLKNIFLTIVL